MRALTASSVRHQRRRSATPARASARPIAHSVAIALALVISAVAPAEAHDHGVLKLASRTIRAGDSLTVSGAKFTANNQVTLVLVGVGGRLALGDIPTDAAGAFRRTLLVPAAARVGQNRLVAEAIDGDEVAALDVLILPASTAASAATTSMSDMPGRAGMAGHEGVQMAPTGAPLPLVRARTPAVTTAAVVLIIVCAAAGALLLRRARANPLEEPE